MAASRAPPGLSPQVSNRRRTSATDVADVDHAGEGLGIDEAEAPGFPEGAAHGCEHVVDGGRLGAVVDQDRAQGHHVLVADLGPVDHERTGGKPAGEQLGGAVEGALQAAAPGGRGLAGEIDGGGIAVGMIGNGDDRHRDRRIAARQISGRHHQVTSYVL